MSNTPAWKRFARITWDSDDRRLDPATGRCVNIGQKPTGNDGDPCAWCETPVPEDDLRYAVDNGEGDVTDHSHGKAHEFICQVCFSRLSRCPSDRIEE